MAIPNIISAIQAVEPVQAWTAAKKIEMLRLYCAGRNYQENIIDVDRNLIANPMTKQEFFNRDIVKIIRQVVEGQQLKERQAEIIIENYDITGE